MQDFHDCRPCDFVRGVVKLGAGSNLLACKIDVKEVSFKSKRKLCLKTKDVILYNKRLLFFEKLYNMTKKLDLKDTNHDILL